MKNARPLLSLLLLPAVFCFVKKAPALETQTPPEISQYYGRWQSNVPASMLCMKGKAAQPVAAVSQNLTHVEVEVIPPYYIRGVYEPTRVRIVADCLESMVFAALETDSTIVAMSENKEVGLLLKKGNKLLQGELLLRNFNTTGSVNFELKKQ